MCLTQLINFVWAITYSNYNERLRDYALELMHPLRGPKSCSFFTDAQNKCSYRILCRPCATALLWKNKQTNKKSHLYPMTHTFKRNIHYKLTVLFYALRPCFLSICLYTYIQCICTQMHTDVYAGIFIFWTFLPIAC